MVISYYTIVTGQSLFAELATITAWIVNYRSMDVIVKWFQELKFYENVFGENRSLFTIKLFQLFVCLQCQNNTNSPDNKPILS